MITARALKPLDKARGQIAPAIMMTVRPLTLCNFFGI
jgi:hypothetical protein